MPRRADPLSVLHVIDRLEVGPPRLEPRRLVAPYKVTQGGAFDVLDFQYSYDENVFDAGDPAALNLAAMLAAQVALNYGLFARELVFHGPYTEADRRFLEAMADNTAREIYVKKFLEPNPFLVGPATALPVVKQDSYLRAKLVFPDSAPAKNGADWATERTRYAVLSSGGKDSLLSYGVLQELGHEVHPIFVNESGRHWFTALNAHREFAARVPQTTRVWTNADRLFAWMLRRLPFVRPDFAKLRSDEYPVRLWTVAVFVFGALPLLRRRGLGRLIVGDEYDTTVRKTHQGVPHYNGLFDQSRYFDNTLTRYYQQKNWNVFQFSVLRPLSELLIEKMLVTRYPQLQALQVSCHAVHLEGDRAHPCGNCEKCRRIVAMLLAVGADPQACGYNEAQIEQCLQKLRTTDLHQETAGAQQLAMMLEQRGLLPEGRIGATTGRARPEVLKLRFDPQRSPGDAIPTDLRHGLYRLFLEVADGAVRRVGKVWVDFDPLTDPELHRPYIFDKAPRPKDVPAELAAAEHPAGYLLGEMTWPQAQKRLREVDIALLPVGAIEQHGPHLPLDTDAFDADYIAKTVAAQCSDPKPIVLPLIPYGVSYHHDEFSGTISVSNETLSRLVYDVGMSCARNGVTKLVIINGHGGNDPTLHFAAQMINRDGHIFTCVDTGESSDTDVNALAETPNDVHAGEIETSTTLALRPELVHMDKARKSVPRFSSRYLDFSSKRSVGWYARTRRISKSGVLGDPTKASREKGEKMWAVIIHNLVEFVNELKSMSLDEIYQRTRF